MIRVVFWLSQMLVSVLQMQIVITQSSCYMYPTLKSPSHAFWRSRARPVLDHGYPSVMYFIVGASVCEFVRAWHMQLCTNYAFDIAMSAPLHLRCYYFCRPFILFQDSTTQQWTYKYEFISEQQAGTYSQSYCDILIRLPLLFRALFNRTRSLLLYYSLSISFSVANVGSVILVLGPFFLSSRSPSTLIISACANNWQREQRARVFFVCMLS